MRAMLALFVISVPALCQTAPAFQWIEKLGSGHDFYAGLGTDAQGNTYVAGTTAPPQGNRDVFVTKLDPSGNVIYSTSVGGSGDDTATAMAVDALGNVYVAGITYSADFPVTKGAFQTTPPTTGPKPLSGSTFLFKLNADGTVGYSTYFATSETNPKAIAVDGSGSAYITGSTVGGLPVTPGAHQPVCLCGFVSNGFFSIPTTDGFVARFDASGSRLIFATYMGVPASIGMATGTSVAVAPDGTAYVGASSGVYRLSATGSALLAHGLPKVNVQAMTLAADGSLYVAGIAFNGPDGFQPTPGAAQANPGTLPRLQDQFGTGSQTAIVRMDGQLGQTLAATYLGGPYSITILSLAVDPAGNLFVGGSTAPHGLPTVTPLAAGFGYPATGFAAKLAGDLSAILFSSYFGDAEYFWVQTVAAAPDGSLILGGATTTAASSQQPGSVWVNRVTVPAAPSPLRIDSVVNAASQLDDPIAAGETIVVRGAGFGGDAKLLINGIAARGIDASATRITAVVPSDVPVGAASVQIASGGSTSNSVLVPVAAASPGLFSVDRSGAGQGYILNHDGTLNSPSNPAHPGDRITIYATGVGPVTFDHGYAVTATPVIVDVDVVFARGVAAVMGPMDGFPGDVYQLTVYVPDHAQFPPQVGVVLTIAGRSSQNGLALSIE